MEEMFLESISGLGEELFKVRNRDCLFSPALTLWLFINQRTRRGASLGGMLEELRDGKVGKLFEQQTETRKGRIVPISMNTSGFSKARHRLPLALVEQVCTELSKTVRLRSGSGLKWRGVKVYALDGTFLELARTEDVDLNFPRARNQHGPVQSPKMLCLFMHDIITGIAVNPTYGASHGDKATSEQALAKRILSQAESGSLIIGDRNFGVFSVGFAAQQLGQDILFRMTSLRAKRLFGEEYSQEKVDKPVTWVVSAPTLKNNHEIPMGSVLRGRVIKRVVKSTNGEPLELLFFTTSKEPADALVKLYRERERIEHDIRALKCTLSMSMLYTKTADMVKKELLLGVAAYNLIRGVITQIAAKVDLLPRQVSFSRAAHLIQVFGPRIVEAKSRDEINSLIQNLAHAFTQMRIYERKSKRTEPRKVVRDKRKFPLMRSSREEERHFVQTFTEGPLYRGTKKPGTFMR